MENAQSFVEGLERQSFVSDLKTRSAAERAIEIIGEASKNIRGNGWQGCAIE